MKRSLISVLLCAPLLAFGQAQRGLENAFLKTDLDAKNHKILNLDVSNLSTLPAQTSHAGQYLTTDGTNPSWVVLNLSAYVPTSRTITTTAPLTGGGALSGNLTLSISAATTGAPGSMSAADKTKLDAITGTNTGDQAWGAITGTLSDQADLQSALDSKLTPSATTSLLNSTLAAPPGTDSFISIKSDGTNVDYKSYATVLGVIGAQPADPQLDIFAGITPGTGVATALAVNVGSSGAFVTKDGALGTPSSGVGTNLTALNASNLSSGTVPAARLDLSLYAPLASPTFTGTVTIPASQTFTTPKIAKIVAPSDSTTAVQITKADGTTAVGTWDTTNSNLTLANNLTVSGGTVTGGSSGLSLAAGGTNQGITVSGSGAASVPAFKLSGVPFAGTGTNSFPLLYINDANATASTTLSTAGTYLGVNGDGTQDLMNLLKDGTSQFKVGSTGVVTIPGGSVIAGGDGGCAQSAVFGNNGGSSCHIALAPPCGASGAQATISKGDGSYPVKFFFGGGSQLPDQAQGMVLAPNGYAEGVQALSGAGAVNITNGATAFTSSGASQALTLADGYNGQIKHVAHVVDGGSGVLTPTTKSGYSTITFTNVGDSVTLQFFTTAGWCITGSYGVTITP